MSKARVRLVRSGATVWGVLAQRKRVRVRSRVEGGAIRLGIKLRSMEPRMEKSLAFTSLLDHPLLFKLQDLKVSHVGHRPPLVGTGRRTDSGDLGPWRRRSKCPNTSYHRSQVEIKIDVARQTGTVAERADGLFLAKLKFPTAGHSARSLAWGQRTACACTVWFSRRPRTGIDRKVRNRPERPAARRGPNGESHARLAGFMRGLGAHLSY